MEHDHYLCPLHGEYPNDSLCEWCCGPAAGDDDRQQPSLAAEEPPRGPWE